MKKAQNKSNIEILKNYVSGERPFVQVGYMPPTIDEKHKEGEIWKDETGKEWIQTTGGKISKTLYDTREATRQICSTCKKDIYWAGNRYDEKFFNKTGKCYDCVIEEETQMKIDGTFDTYEKIKVIQNQYSFLKELKLKIEESIAWSENKDNKLEYMNEDGTIEKWTDTSRNKFIENAKIDLYETNKSMILCQESLSMLEKELNEIKSKKF